MELPGCPLWWVAEPRPLCLGRSIATGVFEAFRSVCSGSLLDLCINPQEIDASSAALVAFSAQRTEHRFVFGDCCDPGLLVGASPPMRLHSLRPLPSSLPPAVQVFESRAWAGLELASATHGHAGGMRLVASALDVMDSIDTGVRPDCLLSRRVSTPRRLSPMEAD